MLVKCQLAERKQGKLTGKGEGEKGMWELPFTSTLAHGGTLR